MEEPTDFIAGIYSCHSSSTRVLTRKLHRQIPPPTTPPDLTPPTRPRFRRFRTRRNAPAIVVRDITMRLPELLPLPLAGFR
jgi:hypothetical protein